MEHPITLAPYTYLLPVEESNNLVFYIAEHVDPAKKGTLMYTPEGIASLLSSTDPELFQEWSVAGTFDIDELDAFSESYDPELHRQKPQHMIGDCVGAILALPALLDALNAFKAMQPHLYTAFQKDATAQAFYALWKEPMVADIMARLTTLRKAMTLPKLPLDITTESMGGGDWAFTVQQRYGSSTVTLFRSSACHGEQKELLEAFVMYEAFSSLLPKTLLRFQDHVDGPLLYNSIQDCVDAFSEAKKRLQQLLLVSQIN